MSPGSSTESYPAFAPIGLREKPGKNLNQVTCPDRDSNPGHLVSRPDALTVTPQRYMVSKETMRRYATRRSETNTNGTEFDSIQSNHQLRMDVYTFPELADMVMCYGEARGNGRKVLHMYQQQFQNRNHPHHTMFARLYQRLRDDGSRLQRIGGRPRRHPFSIDDYTELKRKGIEH
ncbi:hypothetical protein ANN_26665 [Periplaneta americana]|uniref:DUF4817 domain-containing protein n=1 Tax=Periplaneta americana TaxID=6978 RepID=A0ABQ8RYN9_PERAM|nr:hypothetical protein ANN_26665 [Periplaneta americana]